MASYLVSEYDGAAALQKQPTAKKKVSANRHRGSPGYDVSQRPVSTNLSGSARSGGGATLKFLDLTLPPVC